MLKKKAYCINAYSPWRERRKVWRENDKCEFLARKSANLSPILARQWWRHFRLTTSVTGFQVESGAREETGRLRDVKRCVATGDRTRVPGFSLLRHTARPPQHDTTGPRHRAFDVFQGSCYTILLPSARHPARASKPSSATSVTGFQVESGAREETGRFRDVKRFVATGDRTRVSGFSLLRHTARPPQHDTTGPLHRAFDVFQGSCYNLRLTSSVSLSLSLTDCTSRTI